MCMVELVDLHLRTKADLYSFMQCSFVKIQDLIGYVSEYMLMQPKTTYKATYVCRLFVMIWMKIKLLLASANSIPGRYYRCILTCIFCTTWLFILCIEMHMVLSFNLFQPLQA